MTKLLLSLHVLAAILAVGPVAIAASMFPPAARRTLADGSGGETLRTLHRICRVYAALGIAVPVLGLATASSLGVLGDPWLLTAIGLTAVAAGLLVFGVLPRQEALLAAATSVGAASGGAAPGGAAPGGAASGGATISGPPSDGAASGVRATARLAMSTGLFNVLWAAVTVLMVWRPGSTTGA
ncbi:hypothetical protein AB0J86_26685 [Micromonospora sp. NPDC049559]|uniref:hypothetical protein n=1 Tax=Micromonospora sp. NPDC049559 TaxID=3155923 RepID=UPI00342DDC68